MVGGDSMGPDLHLVRACFFNFLLRKLSQVQTLRNVDISQNSNGHISVLHDTRVTWLGKLLALHVLCMLM